MKFELSGSRVFDQSQLLAMLQKLLWVPLMIGLACVALPQSLLAVKITMRIR